MSEDLVRRARERDGAVVHDEDAAAVGGEQGDLLLDDDDRDAEAAVDVGERLEDDARADRVERRRGLVEHEHAGLEGQDRGDGDLLLLAARQRGDLAMAQLGDTDGGKRAPDAALDLVMGHAEVLEAEEQFVLDDRGDHLRVDVLVDRAHDARDVGQRDVAGVRAVDDRGAEQLAGVVVRDGS